VCGEEDWWNGAMSGVVDFCLACLGMRSYESELADESADWGGGIISCQMLSEA